MVAPRGSPGSAGYLCPAASPDCSAGSDVVTALPGPCTCPLRASSPLSPARQTDGGGQVRPLTSSDPHSFFSRFLGQILQLSFVKYLLKMLQKAWVWIGFVIPVETMISQLCPTRSPPRPGRLARKRRGRLVCLLLSVVPPRIQNILGSLPATSWGQGNQPREILEAPINPSSKASKRKRDDVALEEQESWFVVLEKDLPEDDSEDLTYEPSDEESDSEEYRSYNDTEAELELEEQDGITVMLKESLDPQRTHNPQELVVLPGLEDPAGSSSGEGAADVGSGDGDAQKPQADVSSGQEADTE
ncbi:uncharacterized protein LOC116798987 [Chiroxiphia lanceolata]|uniref:uncharacterized protein LOC116798987 n=1 Tax=Chiroxiphia lanceolata TaxID=296741 RepID=UPI0013CF3718|nr:uncharacterized protein LOC116798987 [Chiroxiphia lanceolata]